MVRRGNIKIDEALSLRGGIAVDSPATTPTDKASPALLHNAAVAILSSVGVAIKDDAWRREIISAGGVALATGRIALPEKIIDNALTTAPQKIERVAADKNLSFTQDDKKIFFALSAAASHVYEIAPDNNADQKSSQFSTLPPVTHRAITVADNLALVKLVHALPLFDMGGFFAKPDMLARELGAIDAAYDTMVAQLYNHFAKPFTVQLHNHDIMAQLSKKFPDLPQRASLSLAAFLPNLSLDGDLAASFMLAVKQNMTIDNHALTIAAATAPATTAGGITLGLAMNLAALVLAQIINPGIAFSFGFTPYASDLKQGTITTGSAETILLQQLAITMARFYNIPTIVSTTQTSAKVPDVQAGVEKSLGLLSLVQTAKAAQQGVIIGQCAGILGDLQIIGQTNLVTDHDMLGMVKRLSHAPTITADTIQQPVIERVLRKASHFFAEPETRQVMKSNYLYPLAQDRLSLTSWLAAGNFTADMLAKKIIDEDLLKK
ncbi:MAG: trimethylamine methyltransferase family protein [Hydrotalea sp.]|nr:trimethylamine methyltransferase family protein [Hydrotalea sp.]